MKIFDYADKDSLGKVRSVDTATVIVQVEDVEKLRKLQVNRLAVLESSRPGQHLIGLIQKITRTAIEDRTYALTAARNCGVKCSLPGMKPVTKAATTWVNNSVFHW